VALKLLDGELDQIEVRIIGSTKLTHCWVTDNERAANERAKGGQMVDVVI
jgi:hypothetical protein